MCAHRIFFFRCSLVLLALGCTHARTPRSSGVGAPGSTHSAAQSSLAASRVLRVGFTVSNLERSERAFEALDFRELNAFEPASAALSTLYGLPSVHARVAELALGAESIELTECQSPVGRPIPSDSRSNDAWFQHVAIVVSDMDRAFAHLARHFASAELEFSALSPAPQTIPLSNPAAGGVRALYFRDRDAHNLELIWFPSGKGRALWHTPSSALFLGIDHSAIAVRDAEHALGVYTALGFALAGASLNYGAEQVALSGVPAARVAITGLRDAAGPGVEFLSYLAPSDGRPAPSAATACDLWHWEITIAVPKLEVALSELAARGVDTSSSAIVAFSDSALGYRRAVLVRDLDGHALRLVET